MAKHTLRLMACGLGIVACSGASTMGAARQPTVELTQRASPVARSPGGSAAVAAVPSWTTEEAHRLVIAGAACWLGGVWSEAEGTDAATRAVDAERRCHQLVRAVYGSDDQGRYDRLRALDPVAVSDLKAKIQAVARFDSIDHAREQQLGTFLDAIANAEREAMLVRRAGDRVKKDAEGSRERLKLTSDEVAAVIPLNDARAFEALLGIEMGELTPEAKAVAILAAMDRMETARGLTKHLKVYALARPFTVLFNTTTPAVSTDAHEPLEGGVWLAYITEVAGAAGHPVPDMALAPADREALAWGGTLEGLADKLRAEAQQMSDTTELPRVATNVVHQIDSDYRASEAAILRDNGEVSTSVQGSSSTRHQR